MKYFSPSYWLKMWILSAPLFNDKTQGINAMSIDNDIKDWVNENTTDVSVVEHQELNFSNSTEFINYQTQLDSQLWNNNLNPVSTHKHRHEKNKNRHKRSINIRVITPALVINQFLDTLDNRQYSTSVDNIISSLRNAGIIQRVDFYTANSSNSETAVERFIFAPSLPTAKNDLNLVIMPVNFGDSSDVTIKLVLNARDLYIHGFILIDRTGTEHYFHFHGNDIINRIDNISNNNTYNLGFLGTYNELGQVAGSAISSISIYNSFDALRRLTNFRDYRDNTINNRNMFRGTNTNTDLLRGNLVNVIMTASEALRTRSIRNRVNTVLYNSGATINWESDIRPQASNWQTNSQGNDLSDIIILHPNALRTLDLEQPNNPRYTYPYPNLCVDQLINSRIMRSISIDENCLIIKSVGFLQKDSSISTNVKKGSMWIGTNKGLYFQYQNGYTDTTNDNSNPIIGKITNLDESVKFIGVDHQGSAYAISDSGGLYYIAGNSWNARKIDISHKVLEVKSLLDDSNSNSNIKAGALYIGTERGIYFINGDVVNSENPKVERFNGLDFPIVDIKLDNEGSAYIINNQQEIYHLNIHGWGSEKCANENNLKFLFNYDEIIDKEKCQVNENFVNYFQVEGKSGSDVIKLQFLPETALKIADFYQDNKDDEELFKVFLLGLIKTIKQIDDTWVFGAISDSDHNTAVNFIYDHFSNFQNLVTNLKIKKGIQNKVVIVRTTRASDWNNENSLENIHIWDIKKANIDKFEFKRKKRENVVINKNKWTDDFKKSVNNDKQISMINNTIDIKEINSILFNNQTDTNYVTNNNVTVSL